VNHKERWKNIKLSSELMAYEKEWKSLNGTEDSLDQVIKDIHSMINIPSEVLKIKPSEPTKRFDPATGENCK